MPDIRTEEICYTADGMEMKVYLAWDASRNDEVATNMRLTFQHVFGQ